jgi:hypothetical protein
MEYKGIEYNVVQTGSPTGWKWTILVDATRRRNRRHVFEGGRCQAQSALSIRS